MIVANRGTMNGIASSHFDDCRFNLFFKVRNKIVRNAPAARNVGQIKTISV